MRELLLAIFFCALVACATTVVIVPIRAQFVDHPSEHRIELLYKNDTGKMLCLSAENWPNQAGKLNQVSDRVFLVVGGERFAVENFNTGYCIGNVCATRVAPGEQISGSIPYADFGLPERLKNASKTLEFSPAAFECKINDHA